MTRGTATLAGAAIAGFLIWLATQFELDGSAGDYWAAMGLLAAAGLTMALSQLLGGWTKWGWPRLSGSVFLLGFLPALVAAGWVLLSAQPADYLNTSSWSEDIGVLGLVDDLARYVGALAFAVGLVFGFTFDTTGPRLRREVEPVTDGDVAERPAPRPKEEPDTSAHRRSGRGERRVEIREGGTPVAPRPDPSDDPD